MTTSLMVGMELWDLENPCATNGLRTFSKRKTAKNRGESNGIRTPDKNKRLQTSNECNSEKNIQNAVHLDKGRHLCCLNI